MSICLDLVIVSLIKAILRAINAKNKGIHAKKRFQSKDKPITCWVSTALIMSKLQQRSERIIRLNVARLILNVILILCDSII